MYQIKSYNPQTNHTLYLPNVYLFQLAAAVDASLLAELFPHLLYTVEEVQ
jgi:hypothetical protein